MIAIRTYNDTKIELNIATKELVRLLNKQEKIYCECFGITSNLPKTVERTRIEKGKKKREDVLKDENFYIKGVSVPKDKNSSYMEKMEAIDEITGLSLSIAIENQKNVVTKLEYYIKSIENDIKELKGIEYQLYYAIVIDPKNTNKSITKIIEEVSSKKEISKEPGTLWKNYYPKIVKYLIKLKKSSENTVK